MIELLAPAGDLEKLKIAYLYGADAVYVGGQNFSLRANAKNFSIQDLEEGARFAHQLGKKLFVTVNIIFHEENVTGLEDYLKTLDRIGIDAIIVSDFYVVKLVEQLHLHLEVHLSTQASVLNEEAALFYQKHGVSRIVLAREANREDIKKIKEKTGLELECFVHGAMCTSFSGRCVLSNVVTNRDANRGGCAQVCRFLFETDAPCPFSMTSKDLNMILHIKEMMVLGVNSFKVEGRMRGIYYIATVILTYRKIIDKIMNQSLTLEEAKYYEQILNRCANRESTPQFFKGLPTHQEQYYLGRDEVSNQDFLGLVLDYDEKSKKVKVEERNYFKVGDVVEFFGPNTETFTYTIHKIENDQGEDITVANHPGMILYLPCEVTLQKYDMMRIKVFDKPDLL